MEKLMGSSATRQKCENLQLFTLHLPFFPILPGTGELVVAVLPNVPSDVSYGKSDEKQDGSAGNRRDRWQTR